MTRELEMAGVALAVLTAHGIPPDVQELLVYGNPNDGIAPGALSKAIRAVLLWPNEWRQEDDDETTTDRN